MRHDLQSRISTFGLLLLTLGACARSPLTLPEDHATAIRDSVATALEQFERYSSTAEWDSLVTMYSDSPTFRFLESGRIRYTSRAEVREGFAALPPAGAIATIYSDLEIDPIAPGMAVSTAQFETTFSTEAGPVFRFGGALTQVWVHEADGWRIRSGHSSSPVGRGG